MVQYKNSFTVGCFHSQMLNLFSSGKDDFPGKSFEKVFPIEPMCSTEPNEKRGGGNCSYPETH